jgi:Mg-chelatase subunit ChlD
MIQQTTHLPGIEATVTAHEEAGKRCVLVAITASARNEAAQSPLQIALVADRSGSMDGEKLEITKDALAQFVRSVGPRGRIAVLTYDDEVQLVCDLEPASESLARRIESIESGGSTNLYAGWVAGAKLVGRGGRVILLSDGLANVGRITAAEPLARHAATSYERFGVTTTTIGVGHDYDERLMAGMARAGGGAHYFAQSAGQIVAAFSQERYSAGAVVIESVSVRGRGHTEQFGHFWAGEAKRRVLPIEDLSNLKLTVRYTDRAGGETFTQALQTPSEFGYSEDARLVILLTKAADAEEAAAEVRDPRAAGELRTRISRIVLELLAHPASEEPAVAAVVARLKLSIESLADLERNYDEASASLHRKRSMQVSYNLRERAKGFASGDEDAAMVSTMARETMKSYDELTVDPRAFEIVPIEQWLRWSAAPVSVVADSVTVAMDDPRNGFLISEIERATGRRVQAVRCEFDCQTLAEVLASSGTSGLR